MKLDPTLIFGGLILLAGGIYLYLYLNRPTQQEEEIPPFEVPLPTNQYVVDPLQLEDIYSRHARPFSYHYNDSVRGWNVDNIHRSFRDYLQNKYTLY